MRSDERDQLIGLFEVSRDGATSWVPYVTGGL